jgi:hypothetical protein
MMGITRSPIGLALLALGTLSACSPQPTAYEGVYYWSEDVQTFTPCKSVSTYWAITPEPLSARLSMAYREFAPEPFEGIYAQVLGRYVGPGTDKGEGFEEQYAGVFEITDVQSVQKVIPDGCEITTGSSEP